MKCLRMIGLGSPQSFVPPQADAEELTGRSKIRTGAINAWSYRDSSDPVFLSGRTMQSRSGFAMDIC